MPPMQEVAVPHAADAILIPMHSAIIADAGDTVWTSTGIPATSKPANGCIGAGALEHDW